MDINIFCFVLFVIAVCSPEWFFSSVTGERVGNCQTRMLKRGRVDSLRINLVVHEPA